MLACTVEMEASTLDFMRSTASSTACTYLRSYLETKAEVEMDRSAMATDADASLP